MNIYIKSVIIFITLFFIYQLYKTNSKYNIFSAFNTIESSNSWLKITIFDFYLQTLAFSTIVLNSENLSTALIWISLNCIIGSPVSILYILTRNSLKLG